MGKSKLGSWWAAGAAVCLLVSAGVAAQTAAPGAAAPAAPEAAAPPMATVESPYNERGGGDQRVLTELHRRNQQVIVDAQIAIERATTPAVKDFANSLLSERAATDAKIVNYARQLGMNVEAIRTGAGAMANGALTRVDLVNSTPERFDTDFATKMVNVNQATLDQTQEGQALARAPGMAAMLRQIAPTLLQQQAAAMALVATLAAPPPSALQFPGQPPGVSRTHTGIDTRPGVAP